MQYNNIRYVILKVRYVSIVHDWKFKTFLYHIETALLRIRFDGDFKKTTFVVFRFYTLNGGWLSFPDRPTLFFILFDKNFYEG